MRKRRHSVLIAESNRSIARSLRQHLENAGFQTLSAHDGEQAAILAARQRFDLIITNIELPLMSGADLCRHVRDDLQLTEVPIALCATTGQESDIAHLVVKYEIASVFYKPIDHESVVAFALETAGNVLATA